jgi:hypothetical protein
MKRRNTECYISELLCAAAELILGDGAVVSVGRPVPRDDLVGHQLPARLVGDAQRKRRGEPVIGVQPPDGSPGLAHRRPRLGVALHEVHLHDIAVAVFELDEHREVDGAGALLDVERHLLARVVAGHSACDMFPLASLPLLGASAGTTGDNKL